MATFWQPRSRRTLGRRAFLAAAAAGSVLGLTACPAPGRAGASSAATSAVTPDPLGDILTAYVSLRSAYDAAFAAFPGLAATTRPGATLGRLREETDRHVRAVAAAMAVRPPSASTSPTGRSGATTGSTAPTSAAGTSATGDPAVAVADLRAAETALRSRLEALLPTIASVRAPLVGSLVASAACHVVVLT